MSESIGEGECHARASSVGVRQRHGACARAAPPGAALALTLALALTFPAAAAAAPSAACGRGQGGGAVEGERGTRERVSERPGWVTSQARRGACAAWLCTGWRARHGAVAANSDSVMYACTRGPAVVCTYISASAPASHVVSCTKSCEPSAGRMPIAPAGRGGGQCAASQVAACLLLTHSAPCRAWKHRRRLRARPKASACAAAACLPRARRAPAALASRGGGGGGRWRRQGTKSARTKADLSQLISLLMHVLDASSISSPSTSSPGCRLCSRQTSARTSGFGSRAEGISSRPRCRIHRSKRSHTLTFCPTALTRGGIGDDGEGAAASSAGATSQLRSLCAL